MDEAAPITWLINQINVIVNAGAASTASAIAGVITPIVSACFGIYVLLTTINYMRGAESEPVIDFMLKMAAWSLVIGFGLNADNYNTQIAPIVTGLGTDLSNAVGGGVATAGTLDQLALFYLNIISGGMKAAEEIGGLSGLSAEVMVALKSGIILIGLIPFLLAATLAIIVANVGSQIIAMVGPLFFAFLLFPATRQYFSAWLNSALSYAFVPLIIAVVASISIGISNAMLTPAGQDLSNATFKDVFLAAIGNLLLLFLLKTVAGLASSLSSGGINAQMPGSVGTLAQGIHRGVGGTRRELRAAKNDAQALGNLAASAGRGLANRFNSVRKAG